MLKGGAVQLATLSHKQSDIKIETDRIKHRLTLRLPNMKT